MKPRADSSLDFHEFGIMAPAPALVAGYTGRQGGVSEAPYDDLNLAFHVGDDPAAVTENRRRVAAEIGLDLRSFVVPSQVHEGEVVTATRADRGRGALSIETALPDSDALVTREPGVVLAVMIADCVPVVLYDPVVAAIGVAHAGWSGTVRHVTRNAVEAMAREFGSDTGQMVAAIGPSIGPDSYEVGPEVATAAQREFRDAEVIRPAGNGRFLFDLWTSNLVDLLEAGLNRTSIEVTGIDTFRATDRYFSHRRQRPTGRFMALAALMPDADRRQASAP